MKWSRKGYDLADIEDVKGLGFCVSVEHALYMAKVFNEAGIPAVALHGNSSEQERRTIKIRTDKMNLYNFENDIDLIQIDMDL